MPSGYIGKNPDPAWWAEQIKAGMDFRKRQAYQGSWDRWRRFYRGDYTGDVLPVNLFFTLMRTIVPRVYFRNPSVSIQPAKPGFLFMAFARIQERIDNRLMQSMRMKQEIKRMTADAFLMGTAIGKLGFGAQYAYDIQPGSTSAPGVGGRNERIEYRDHIQGNMPWFARSHPGNFVVPDQTEIFEDARWTADIIRRSVSDVQSDPRLRRKQRMAVQSGTIDNIFMGQRSRPGRRRADGGHVEDSVDLVEIRDKKTQRVIILTFQGARDGQVLYEGFDPLQDHGMPNFPLIFNPDPEVFWGLPDSQILEPYQREINEIRTQSMKHRRLSLLRIAVRAGTIDDAEVLKMLSPDVGPVIKFNSDPRTSMHAFQMAEVPLGLSRAAAEIMQDVRETVGFSRNQFGEFKPGSGDTTATEANIVRMASEIRVDERRDQIADLIVDVIEGVHNIIYRNWGTEQIIDVIGPGGVPIWVRFQPEMLKVGQYSIKIDPDNSVPETRQVREQRAALLFDRLRTNPLIDPLKLTQYLLHETHGVQFDDMLRVLPPLGNAPRSPVSPQDLAGIMQNSAALFAKNGPDDGAFARLINAPDADPESGDA